MTFKTTVRDGLIIINTHGAVPDGTEVQIALPTSIARAGRNGRSVGRPKATAKNAKSKPKRSKDPIPGFGAWKHRTDIGDGAEFVQRLRNDVFKRDGK